ncbi:hypothetical protein PoB_005720500 [Plakobranchus ocellatus]|uniref:Uncharacterized protein n=1 Tax=Plakobranchus ocellatus TaxID=259542 RepID=A0AAV4CD60_9GAST|nr:hypothetical protein PoB_005720500 [Plakobranchus ocellatus]
MLYQEENVGGRVDNKSALRSAGTLLPRVQASPLEPWPRGGFEILRFDFTLCKQATHINAQLHQNIMVVVGYVFWQSQI